MPQELSSKDSGRSSISLKTLPPSTRHRMMRIATLVRLFLLLCGVIIWRSSRVEAGSPVPDGTKVILVAIREGTEGEADLREWSTYADKFDNTLPSVWVLCPNEAIEDSVLQMPRLRPFVVDTQSSWASVIERFASEHDATALGLFGEGSTPHPDLADSIMSMCPPLSKMQVPTAVVSRSRLRDTGQWLPDTFVSQVWVNRAMLESSRLGETGLGHTAVEDLSFLAALPLVILQPLAVEGVLVDGTNVVGSTFAASEGADVSDLPVARSPRFASMYFGTLSLALIHVQDGVGADIVRAPWPPRYVLDTAATENGVVVVSNVNCGYLDMAVNFMLSVERTSGEKVLFVTMDEVSFDFMDALAPGCTVMFPLESGAERPHASRAGKFGDPAFAAEVLVRPTILQHILKQKYTALWSDSDIVWLGNPLPLLPDVSDPSSAEVMLQHDGREDMACTCFMFLKPTPSVHTLLTLWEKHIISMHIAKNQIPFQKPLQKMRGVGLKVEYIPDNVMPHGAAFFSEAAVENYAQVVKPEAKVAHNNFIKGHDNKQGRFKEYHLWWVEGMHFPTCDE